jgi:uncharacterized membrane protein
VLFVLGAIIALLLAMLLANLGLIPTVTEESSLYRYLIGIGALVGVATAFWLTGAQGWLGGHAAAVGGTYAATYIGGSANLTAVALHFGVIEHPPLMAAVNIVDNVVGSLWIAALVILARLLQRLNGTRPAPTDATGEESQDTRRVSVAGLAALLALAFAAFWLAQQLAAWTSERGLAVPAILIVTTHACSACTPPISFSPSSAPAATSRPWPTSVTRAACCCCSSSRHRWSTA